MADPKHYWGIRCRRRLKDDSVDEYWEGVQYTSVPALHETKKDAETSREFLTKPFWSKVIKWECPATSSDPPAAKAGGCDDCEYWEEDAYPNGMGACQLGSHRPCGSFEPKAKQGRCRRCLNWADKRKTLGLKRRCKVNTKQGTLYTGPGYGKWCEAFEPKVPAK